MGIQGDDFVILSEAISTLLEGDLPRHQVLQSAVASWASVRTCLHARPSLLVCVGHCHRSLCVRRRLQPPSLPGSRLQARHSGKTGRLTGPRHLLWFCWLPHRCLAPLNCRPLARHRCRARPHSLKLPEVTAWVSSE